MHLYTPSQHEENPLSPYLFILCIEGLFALIQDAKGRGALHAVKVCRGAPIIYHILFVDDNF